MLNAALLRELPVPQRLALTYAEKGSRSVTMAMLALDARLAAIVRSAREPIAAQLRLAWWRERLHEHPAAWPRGEPVLEALRTWRNPAALAILADGWEQVLAERLDEAAVAAFCDARGAAWRAVAEELAAGDLARVFDAARLWGAADLACHTSDARERALTLDMARRLPVPPRLPRALRTLAVLAGFARRSVKRGGAPSAGDPGSMLLALRIGLTGR